MRKLSRRHTENLKKTKSALYSNLEEAVALKETATTKFVESVELHANLILIQNMLINNYVQR
jgi:ribosomal protein L1